MTGQLYYKAGLVFLLSNAYKNYYKNLYQRWFIARHLLLAIRY